MTCQEFEEHYILMLYEELNKDEMSVYKEHLSSCPECKNLFEEIKETKSLFEHMEQIEAPDYLLDKVRANTRKYRVSSKNPLKEYVKNILNFLFRHEKRLVFASILLLIITGACLLKVNYIAIQNNTINNKSNMTALYEEEKLDKDIKNIEVNTASFSDSHYSFGIEKKNSTWDVSCIDQKMTDMETEVKNLKKECETF
jgi:hypothetical protein